MVSILSLTEDISLSHGGYFFLSQRTFLSLTEDISYSHRGTFYLSQKNTEEQNTQMPTETLSQPITQNITATEASPPAPLRMERGVITEIPLYVIHAFSVSSPFLSRPIGVTSHTTPLSIRRGAGGEASPIEVTTHTMPLPVGERLWEVPAVERRENHLLSLASPVLSRNLSLLPT